MPKKSAYTKITPLPSNIPRQLALELLHSHEEVIRLNPLVTGVKAIEAPRDAATDEFFSTWYEISQVIGWGLGIKSKYSFRGVFHDQPWGLQTHVYAPMGVDMRNKYRIGGNQPGEPREARELGVDTPLDGLYLREDVEIMCNVAMMSFVRKEAKEATGIMISRLTRKAELLDEGKLHAMFEDGRLKTAKPLGGYDDSGRMGSQGSVSPPSSPGLPYARMAAPPSPALSHASFPRSSQGDIKGFANYHDIARNGSNRRDSIGSSPQGYNASNASLYQSHMPQINEMPGSLAVKPQGGVEFRSELPGDETYNHPQQQHYAPQAPSSPPGQALSPQLDSRAPKQRAQQQPDHSPVPPPPKSELRSIIAASSLGPQQYTPYMPTPATYQPQRLGGGGSAASNPRRASWQQAPPTAPQASHAQPYLTNAQQQFARMSLEPPVPPASAPPTTTVFEQQQQQQHQQQSNQQHREDWPLPLHHHTRMLSEEIVEEGVEDGEEGGEIAMGERPGTAQSAQCPVCEQFEGDEAAVSHHVGTTHKMQ